MLNFLNSVVVRMLGYDLPEGYDWLDGILVAIDQFIFPLLLLVSAAGAIYAVFLGINLARAETADKREEAKKRLIWAIVGVASIVVLVVLCKTLPSIFESILGPTA